MSHATLAFPEPYLTESFYSYKLHGSARPISMKSDVIRKRARHDARRASGNSSETPSASPGASRRASPEGSTPTLAPDSTTQSSSGYSDDNDFRGPSHAELMNAFAGMAQAQHGGHVSTDFASQQSYASLAYPGPYHPDHIPQVYTMMYPQDSYDESEGRHVKRRRMSNDSGSEPPSSTASYGSYSTDSYSSASSTSHSQRSSLDFSYSYAGYGNLFRSQLHPPMVPPDGHSPNFVHPPMLPPDEVPMDYLQTMQHDDTDALFNTYLHPPMLPPEDSPKVSLGALLPHPPMVQHEWSAAYELHDNAMQAY